MIGFLFGLLPFGKIIQMALDISYQLAIKLLGLIFYLASEYWGRWVLAVILIGLGLLYGRYHYIQQGRNMEIRFCDVRIDRALETQCPIRRGSPPKKDDWLPNWPGDS